MSSLIQHIFIKQLNLVNETVMQGNIHMKGEQINLNMDHDSSSFCSQKLNPQNKQKMGNINLLFLQSTLVLACLSEGKYILLCWVQFQGLKWHYIFSYNMIHVHMYGNYIIWCSSKRGKMSYKC